MIETPAELARRINADPDAASDSDKLRSIADWVDWVDVRLGIPGSHQEVQVFLRGLAERLDGS